jgi:hypothetical protein
MLILNHRNTPPSIRTDIPLYLDGSVSHRRVVAKMRGGPANIDIDYNQYRAGLAHSEAYAYSLDEFGYIPSGELMQVSDGDRRTIAPGSFMWRPAGAATQQIQFLTDCVTICAFGPAREADWGYALASEKVGKWDPADGEKPHVHFFHYSQIEPTDLPGAPTDGRVIHRAVISLARNGSRFMDVSHTTLRKGTIVELQSSSHNVISWLETGRLQILAGVDTRELSPTDFLYYGPGEKPEAFVALEDSIYVTWAAIISPDV